MSVVILEMTVLADIVDQQPTQQKLNNQRICLVTLLVFAVMTKENVAYQPTMLHP